MIILFISILNSLFNSYQGNVIGSLLMLFFMLFGGFLLNNASAPVYVQWLQDLSFFNQAFEALAANELAGVIFEFNPMGNI